MNTHKLRTKQEAHEEALSENLDRQFTIGEQLDLIILQNAQENNGREAFARYKDICVFVYPDRISLHSGSQVRVKISEIGENHLKAVAIALLS